MRSYSLRSWLGFGINAVVAVGPIARMVDGSSSWFDPVLLVVCAAVAFISLMSRIDVTDEGIARWPGFLRVAWGDIARFDSRPRPDFIRSIRVVRKHGRASTLTPYSIKPERARALLDALEAELTASRSR